MNANGSIGEQVIGEGIDSRRVFEEAGWLNDPSALIKIDTEGAEYRILASLGPAIADARCRFYIAFHPWVLLDAEGRPDPVALERANSAWLDGFQDFELWTANTGELKRVDKEHIRDLAMAGSPLPEILFSRSADEL